MSKTDLNHIEKRLQDKADQTIKEFTHQLCEMIDSFDREYHPYSACENRWTWKYRDKYGSWKDDKLSGTTKYLKEMIRENIREGYKEYVTEYYAKDLVKKLEMI